MSEHKVNKIATAFSLIRSRIFKLSFDVIMIWIVELQVSDVSNSQRSTDVEVVCVNIPWQKSVVACRKVLLEGIRN